MKAVFENATISDAIQKSARVAPTKGEAFDKASGILMTLDPTENTITLRSTNLDVFYMEVVDAIEVEGEATWRLNAQILSEVMAKLPLGSGKTVSLEQVGGEVILKSNRTTAKFRMMDSSYYPEWDSFDPEALDIVENFGERIKQVEWAALMDHDVAYSGIHLDGEYATATDRYRLAMVECEAEPVYKPITIPAGILKPVLAGMKDVAIGIDQGSFLLMPTPTVQIKTRIYDKEYPNVAALMNRDWPTSVKFKKQRVLEIIERAVIFSKRDRSPKLTFFIGKGSISVMCADADLGLLGDGIDLDEGAEHKVAKFQFTPKNLEEALQNAPSAEVEFYYDPENVKFPVKVDGGSGYRALVMPLKENAGE